MISAAINQMIRKLIKPNSDLFPGEYYYAITGL
jgi:ferritin-like protein